MSNKKELAPIDEFKKSITAMGKEIKKLLPEHITLQKFERVVLTAVQMNQDLLAADRKTLFNACLKAAGDGLLPDGREGAIVTYNTKEGPKAQWMPMVLGVIKKIRNSGELASLTANIVHEKDVFKYFVDHDGEHIQHEPVLFGDKGEAIGCYAIVKTKDGFFYIDVMSKDEIMAVKNSSKAKFGPWDGAFKFEMWKKTVIRRLSKRLPMSSEVEGVIQSDDDLIELDNAPTESKSKKLENLILDNETEKLDTKENVEQTMTAKEETTLDKNDDVPNWESTLSPQAAVKSSAKITPRKSADDMGYVK